MRKPLVHKGQEICCSWAFEQQAWDEGHVEVGGADEVGRGALCGPVVAAVVILGRGFDADGLDDSKRLTERQREVLAERIRAGARSWCLGVAEPREVDRLNILRATHLALRRAVEGMPSPPDLLLVDALTIPG